MQLSRQSAMESGAGVPLIVKGHGHHIWNSPGKQYIEGLSGLSTSTRAMDVSAWPK
jgi:hypothetical protein